MHHHLAVAGGEECSRLSAFHSTSTAQLFPRLFSASSTMILMKADWPLATLLCTFVKQS